MTLRNCTQADLDACNGDATKLPFDTVFVVKDPGYLCFRGGDKVVRLRSLGDDPASVSFALASDVKVFSFIRVKHLVPVEPPFFDLQKALADKRCWTRDGREVTEIAIFNTLRENLQPVQAVIEGDMYGLGVDGKYLYSKSDYSIDLTTIPPAPKKRMATFVGYCGKYENVFIYIENGEALPAGIWVSTGDTFEREVDC